jgi:hypothetical protein
MSHMKIASKIHEIMRLIPDEQAFDKFNELLIVQKLIPQTRYKFEESKEHITRDGVVLQIVTVSCELIIIDTESDEGLTYTALGSGVDNGSLAVVKAQEMAFNRACIGVLNISSTVVVVEPEIIVETPESNLIAEIKALWKWGETELEPYVFKKRGKGLSELSIPELTVERNDLEGYIRGNKNC